MSKMTDYIIDIRDFLEGNNINTDDYDDDRTYFDGYDDVLVVNLKGERYKFLQNYKDGFYKNFTLYSNDGEINGYKQIVKYFIDKFNL